MAKTYLRVYTVDGKVWDSNGETLDETQAAAVHELLQDWRTMNFLRIDVAGGGAPLYLNPANVAAVEVLTHE